MIALPSAPAPAPHRQLLVGTALWCAAAATMLGGMLALWMRFRDQAIAGGQGWLPDGVVVQEVATNIMLLAFVPICLFAQWAVYAGARGDRAHTGLALFLVAFLGVAVINAQAFAWTQMAVNVREGAYGPMFYAVTGTMVVLVVLGIVMSVVTALRYLGARSNDREILAAHALYWYFMAAMYSAVWFVVYVTK
jgi:cytochrome c oxidase subunit 3